MSLTLLFDQDCGFCRWAIDKILRWDRLGQVQAVAIQSVRGREMLETAGVPEDVRLDSWHVVDAQGVAYSAGEAVAPLARALPFGAPVALLAAAFPATTGRAYRAVARNRERIGARLGEAACSIDPSKR